MSHEVESMFYVRKVPWHGLGARVEEAPSSGDALLLAGLDWEVEKRPVAVGDRQVEEYWATVRASDHAVLGIVKDSYRIWQNREAFAFADNLLGHGVRYETAGALSGGKRVWILARLNEPIKLLRDDTVPYLCITNNHDGEGAIRCVVTPVRVVCQNTLSLALKTADRSWSTRHTGEVGSKIAEAARALDLTRHYLGALNEQAELLVQQRVTTSSWRSLLEELFPVSPEPTVKEVRHFWQAYRNRQLDRREWLDTCYRQSDLKPYADTAWAAVNAIIDYTEHVRYEPGTDRSLSRLLDAGHPTVGHALKFLDLTNAA